MTPQLQRQAPADLMTNAKCGERMKKEGRMQRRSKDEEGRTKDEEGRREDEERLLGGWACVKLR